ncbi:MAG: hypothetical protein HOW73_36975 [Polyangiaceae bacterium]|nr:hypothetical protein [Polyangiaceae bacterium]
MSDDLKRSSEAPKTSQLTEGVVRLPCNQPSDRYAASAAAIHVAHHAGLSPRQCQEVGVVAAELASNAFLHAGGGLLDVRALETGGIEIVCRDPGPGMESPTRVLDNAVLRWHERAAADLHPDGFGTGLGAIQMLVDQMSVESTVGVGTTIRVRKHTR